MILLFATLIGTFAVGCLGYLVSSLLTKKDEVLRFGFDAADKLSLKDLI